jgi:signal transduction histidine kinase
MSGERQRAGRRLVRWVAVHAHAGLLAIGQGLALASLIPAGVALLAALLGLLVLPGYGIWVAVSLHYPGYNAGTVMPKFSPSGIVFPGSTGSLPDDGLVRVVGVLVAAFAIALMPLIVPALLTGIRRIAISARGLVGRWAGVPISVPYQPYPGRGSRLRWLLGDPATWRDLGWMAVNASAGAVLLLAPGTVAALGAFSLLRAFAGLPAIGGGVGSVGQQFLLAVALLALGLWTAPPLLQGYGHLTRSVLGRPGTAELNRRISHLAQTRSETIDASAAEIRRIERDLHDGAQARLVAIGMALDAVAQLMESRPEVARELLMHARDNSAKALAEIRGLVRGVHPPVLADRGLADAVRALALDSPQPVSVRGDLTGRLPAPVESAVYFAVSELLANVAKHAEARQVSIDMRHDDDMLTITVADDGLGGADPGAGTGLRGVERRLAAFDGGFTIASPPGGPTAITMELPCALS